MKEEHFVGKVAQKVILVQEGKVLITRDSRDTDTFELPGGRLNVNECPDVGIEREILEELGTKVVIKQPFYIGQFNQKRDGNTALLIVYVADLETPLDINKVDSVEVAEMVWVDQETWSQYKLFPEYSTALNKYFSNPTR